jgi:hypothetical protein
MLRLNVAQEKVYVRAEYVHDMDNAYVGKLVKAKLLSFASYPGHVLTADVVFGSGAVFSYLPLNALVTSTSALDDSWIRDAALSDCCFHNCPDEYASANTLPGLQGIVQLYDRTGRHLRSGRYITTIDWYNGNDLLHVIDAGMLVAWPSHKLLWRSQPPLEGLPKYSRLRHEWRLQL